MDGFFKKIKLKFKYLQTIKFFEDVKFIIKKITRFLHLALNCAGSFTVYR